MCAWLRKLGKIHHLTCQSNCRLQILPADRSSCRLCTVTFISALWQLVFMSDIKGLRFLFLLLLSVSAFDVLCWMQRFFEFYDCLLDKSNSVKRISIASKQCFDTFMMFPNIIFKKSSSLF